MFGQTGSSSYYGVYGYAPSAWGVRGEGYYGGLYATPSYTYGYGVYGYCSGVYMSGVFVYHAGTSSHGALCPGYSQISNYVGVYGYTGSNYGYGVAGLNYTYGAGVYGNNYSSGYGVYGYNSYYGYGVYGNGNYGGLWGYCGTSGGVGVTGYSPSGWGVSGEGVTGVYGIGTYGVIGYGGFRGVCGYSLGSFSVPGYFINFTTGIYAQVASGNYKIVGTGTVSTFIIDENDRERVLHCPEAPEVMFEDYGTARLQSGYCRVDIDPLLLRGVVISDKHPLRAYVTMNDRCGTFRVEKHDTYFEVFENDGSSNARFDWRIVANRRGYQNWRFEAHERPADRKGRPEPTPMEPWPEEWCRQATPALPAAAPAIAAPSTSPQPAPALVAPPAPGQQ